MSATVAPAPEEEEFIPTNDFLGGHQCGLEWAARMVEANDPRTSDWLYDDRDELAAAIRKGPEMPPAPASEVALAALERIERELLNYNPAADEYKGKHIYKVWSRGISAARAALRPTEQAPSQPTKEMK